MRIAVTGSSGFVGSRLINALNRQNYQVISIDLASGIDITAPEDCSSIPEFDTIVHLAGRSFVPDSYKDPGEFYRTNLVGTLNMLELCRKYNARIIFISSYVYGVPRYLPIDEDHPLDSFNPYADTKIQCEHLCRSYKKFFGVQSVIVRPFNIYGPGQHESFLISSIFRQALTGTINLQSSSPKRDYIHIDDVISALMRIISIRDLDSGTFNLGTGVSHSVLEVTELVNKRFNGTLNINFSGSERPNEVTDTIADISRAESILGWKPAITLEEGIKNFYNE